MHPNEALFANEGFYLAFAQGDVDAMDRLWSANPSVLCVHPGWPALTTRAAVLESWARILENPSRPQIAFQVQEVIPMGSVMAVVCYEQVEGAVMLASNLYLEEALTVRMVGHHAGVCANPPTLAEAKEPRLDG